MTRKHHTIKTGQHNTINIRSMKNYSNELLIQKLGEMEFPDYSTYVNVNEAYHDFATRLTDLIDILAPFKGLSKGKIKLQTLVRWGNIREYSCKR